MFVVFRRCLLSLIPFACSSVWAADPPDFDREVAPLFAQRCLYCHNSSDKKGGLDLSNAKSALVGGDSGKAIAPKQLEASLLWERVSAKEMPPKHPLTDAELDLLKRWISTGAAWGTDPIDPFRFSNARRAGYDWWSLQPVRRPELPAVKKQSWGLNAIDAFILARLEKAGLEPAPAADRRSLIRRLSFDLLGLPPSPDEVRAFVDDAAPKAYERLVDRLLASPAYGQRLARHWLDIVRYGESQGFERDKQRTNSWRYRDWVVDAFNADMPFDEFTRLQIAGDVLRSDDAAAITATGFLVAGPYDEPGQVQQSLAMRAIVRQDELEDIVGSIGQTFLGLTVNCARCHDHKFDPILQSEYYQLTAALGGVRHGERELPGDAIRQFAAGQSATIQARADSLVARLDEIESPVRKQILAARKSRIEQVSAPVPMARWEFNGDLKDSVGTLHGTAHGSAIVSDGRLRLDGQSAYVTTELLPNALGAKTLEVWLTLKSLEQRGGGAISVQTPDGNVFDSIVFGERESGRWMAGSNGFSRTESFSAPAETEASRQVVQFVIVYATDGTITGYRNGQPYGRAYRSLALMNFPVGKAQVAFGMRHAPAGSNKMLSGEIERALLYDRALSADEVAATAGVASLAVTDDELLKALPETVLPERERLKFEINQLRSLQQRAQDVKVYAVVPRKADPAHLLKRGNPAQPGDVVAAGGVASVVGVSGNFGLTPDAADADCRRKLAEWITDPRNPLFARVLPNRVWHYLFGSGIVETPNDLGFNGGRPSHPELLDWLASEFVGQKFSVKALHRLIVTSATYQQSSRFDARSAAVDAQNRLLWRKAPARLDAESLRDAMLSVVGALDASLGGPGYEDFTTFVRNSQFYVMQDPVGASFDRRSLYRAAVRSGRNPLLDAFDCPDPSTFTPSRAVTTTPLQALALLNNSFVLRTAGRFAARIEKDAGIDRQQQVARAYELAYNRSPSPDERDAALKFIEEHGLSAFCRVIFNSNEFLYVD